MMQHSGNDSLEKAYEGADKKIDPCQLMKAGFPTTLIGDTSDADGNFKLKLSSGKYIVTADNGSSGWFTSVDAGKPIDLYSSNMSATLEWFGRVLSSVTHKL